MPPKTEHKMFLFNEFTFTGFDEPIPVCGTPKITIPFSDRQEFVLEIECEVDADLAYRLIGADITDRPDSFSLTYNKLVQRRRHKKKRINKKWAKRYGYKTVVTKIDGFTPYSYENGVFEFRKDICGVK